MKDRIRIATISAALALALTPVSGMAVPSALVLGGIVSGLPLPGLSTGLPLPVPGLGGGGLPLLGGGGLPLPGLGGGGGGGGGLPLLGGLLGGGGGGGLGLPLPGLGGGRPSLPPPIPVGNLPPPPPVAAVPVPTPVVMIPVDMTPTPAVDVEPPVVTPPAVVSPIAPPISGRPPSSGGGIGGLLGGGLPLPGLGGGGGGGGLPLPGLGSGSGGGLGGLLGGGLPLFGGLLGGAGAPDLTGGLGGLGGLLGGGLPLPGLGGGAGLLSTELTEAPIAAADPAVATDTGVTALNAVSCSFEVDLRNAAVYTVLNLPTENQVMAYARGADGTLCAVGAFNTGGVSDGQGAQVSGQNAVIADGGYVFVANPGSAEGLTGNGSVSVLRIEQNGLVLTDVESSAGPNPRSVTRHGDLVYVVNAGSGLQDGATETVHGYRFDAITGDLAPLAGSLTATIDTRGDPAQIEFTPDGRHLVISQRRVEGVLLTDQDPRYLEVMTLGENGVPASVLRHDVGGDAPFGFRMGEDNTVYLTHGIFPDSESGGISSHRINADGTVATQTPFFVDGAAETCWNYLSRTTREPLMYTSAYFDSSIGMSQVNADGTLSLVNSRVVSTAASGTTRPQIDLGGLDMYGAVDTSGTEYLYVLHNPVVQPLGLPFARIVGYRIHPEDGSLTQLGESVARDIPNNGFGLWAY